MKQKTQIDAKDDKSDLLITRDFDLPLELLFKAYEDPEIVEQWMGTKVLKLENRQHGGWMFQTSDDEGNVVFSAHGAIHEFTSNQRIIRTFQMDNTPLPVQLEFLEFEEISETSSRLKMQIVYKSVEDRNRMLQLPFAQGINMAHNKLQDVLSKLK